MKRGRAKAPAGRPGRTRTARPPRGRTRTVNVAAAEVTELEAMRSQLEALASTAGSPRWNANPEDVRRSVAKLVLTLIEFVRQLLERQAIRRMEAGTLTDEQTEAVGLALMRLEETVRDIGAQFGLAPEDLTLDLGPVGKLM